MIPLPIIAFAFASAFAQAAPLADAMLHDPAAHGHRGVTPESALINALAALANETPELPAEVLLAISLHESGLSPTSSPRGHWNPAGPVPRRRVLICGLLQVSYEVKPERRASPPTASERAAAWARCRAGMDVFTSYADAVADRPKLQSLGRWVTVCRERYHARNVTACAVSGHAAGGRAGRAERSPLFTYVLKVATRLHRARDRAAARWSRVEGAAS